jgi:hypothetical protein
MNFFFIFRSSKIYVKPIDFVSSLFLPRCGFSSDRCRHTTASCHASFSISSDELVASASSFDNALFCRLPCRAETEALNLHHHRSLPSLDRPTPTLHCYKKIISTFVTIFTTQPRLYFSSPARVSCHRKSTRNRCSLSPLSHAHYPSAQRHPR